MLYPTGNYYSNALAGVQFVDPAHGNWRLSASSPYKGQGSNGTDPGVNMDTLMAALGAAYTPNQTPNPTPTPTPTPSPTQFAIVMTSATQAAAVNSITQTASPFVITTPQNFGNDTRTRLTVFATGITSAAVNSDRSNDLTINGVVIPNFAEAIAVEARRSDGSVFRLPVEFAGALPAAPPLEQVNIILLPDLQGWGFVQLTLIISGNRSNSGMIFVQ
jgi:hypothetical protein